MNKQLMWLSIIFFVVFFMLIGACGGLAWLWSTDYQWWVVALMALGSALLTAISLFGVFALDRGKKPQRK